MIRITNRCNLECKMCRFRESSKIPRIDLSFSQIKRLVSGVTSRFFIRNLTLTGGEPFLNPEIEKIYKYLAAQCKNNKIRRLKLSTNGYLTKKVIQFLTQNKSSISNLFLHFSLDGPLKVHNLIRGKDDAYQKTDLTINKIRLLFPELNLGVGFTITPANYQHIEYVYEYCLKRNIQFFPDIMVITDFGVDLSRTLTKRNKDLKSVFSKVKVKLPEIEQIYTRNQRSQIIKCLSAILKQEVKEKNRIVQLSELVRVIKLISHGKSIIKSCKLPMYFLLVRESGDIFPCPYMWNLPIANLNQENFEKQIFGKLHLNIIKRGLKLNCPKCFGNCGYLELE